MTVEAHAGAGPVEALRTAEPAWRAALQGEWQIMHAEHEQAERTAMCLKAGAIGLTFLALASGIDLLLGGLLLLVLWLQEAIVRTVQARVTERLLHVEALLRAPDGNARDAFQLHSSWQQTRGGTVALCRAYAANAWRPTVAYPYIVLLAILVLGGLLPDLA